MEKLPLTSRQREILDYMVSFTQELGYPPTVREICKATGLRSPRSVSQHLQSLERKGYIARGRDKSRAIRFLHEPVGMAGSASPENVISLPLMGKAAAGNPAVAFEPCEVSYSMDRSLFDGGHAFVMRVEGECPTGAHIVEGDLVVVDPDADTHDGDVVVASIGDLTAIKRYHIRDGSAVLSSGNGGAGSIDLAMRPGGVRVVGKVVGLIRKLS
jgi:repressor LexA